MTMSFPESIDPVLLGRLANDAVLILLDTGLKVAVVLALALVFHRFLRQSPSRVRCTMWGAAFAIVLALPFVQPLADTWQIPLLPRPLAQARFASQPADVSAPIQLRSRLNSTSKVPTPIKLETKAREHQVEISAEAIRPSEAPAIRSSWTQAPTRRVESGPQFLTLQTCVETDAPEHGYVFVTGASDLAPANISDCSETVTIQEVFLPEAQVESAGMIQAGEVTPLWSTCATQLANLCEIPWTIWALGAWLLGLLAVIGRFALGLVRANDMASTAVELNDDPSWRRVVEEVAEEWKVKRPVRVLWSERAPTPMTWGVRRPIVLLPGEAEDWSRERRRVVLAHEFAHIRRYDWFVQVMGRLACAVYWFNPLVWVAAKRLAFEREQACDVDVLAKGARPSEYAGHLLEIARSMNLRTAVPVATLAMARRSELEGRLMSILNADTNRHRARRGMTLTVTSIITMTAAAAGLAAVSPWTEPDGETTKEHRIVVTQPEVAGEVVAIGGAPRADGQPILLPEDVSGTYNVVLTQDDGTAITVKIKGAVKFDCDKACVTEIAPGTIVGIRRVEGDLRRHCFITGSPDGKVDYECFLNGEPCEFTDECSEWVTKTLAECLKQGREGKAKAIAIAPAPAMKRPQKIVVAPGEHQPRVIQVVPQPSSREERIKILIRKLKDMEGRLEPQIETHLAPLTNLTEVFENGTGELKVEIEGLCEDLEVECEDLQLKLQDLNLKDFEGHLVPLSEKFETLGKQFELRLAPLAEKFEHRIETHVVPMADEINTLVEEIMVQLESSDALNEHGEVDVEAIKGLLKSLDPVIRGAVERHHSHGHAEHEEEVHVAPRVRIKGVHDGQEGHEGHSDGEVEVEVVEGIGSLDLLADEIQIELAPIIAELKSLKAEHIDELAPVLDKLSVDEESLEDLIVKGIGNVELKLAPIEEKIQALQLQLEPLEEAITSQAKVIEESLQPMLEEFEAILTALETEVAGEVQEIIREELKESGLADTIDTGDLVSHVAREVVDDAEVNISDDRISFGDPAEEIELTLLAEFAYELGANKVVLSDQDESNLKDAVKRMAKRIAAVNYDLGE